jgi:rhodanese-related sulfurtransferase
MSTIFRKSLITIFTVVTITTFWYLASIAGNTRMMSIAELKARIGSSSTVVLDVRADSHWNTSDQKIKGALRVDPDDFNSWGGLFPKGRTIVFYCA